MKYEELVVVCVFDVFACRDGDGGGGECHHDDGVQEPGGGSVGRRARQPLPGRGGEGVAPGPRAPHLPSGEGVWVPPRGCSL